MRTCWTTGGAQRRHHDGVCVFFFCVVCSDLRFDELSSCGEGVGSGLFGLLGESTVEEEDAEWETENGEDVSREPGYVSAGKLEPS